MNEKIVSALLILCMVCVLTLILYWGYGLVNGIYIRFNENADSKSKELVSFENNAKDSDSRGRSSYENKTEGLKSLGSGHWDGDVYTNSDLNLVITAQPGWHHSLNKDNTITIGNGNTGESFSFNVIKEQFDTHREDNIQRYTEDYRIVDEQIIQIEDKTLSCIVGYYFNRDTNYIVGRAYTYQIPDSDYLLTIEAFNLPGNESILADMLSDSNDAEYIVLNEETILDGEYIDISTNERKIDPTYDVEYNMLNKYGIWDVTKYTNDTLDLKITMPYYWGYNITEDNYFHITSKDFDEEISLSILNGKAEELLENEMNQRTNNDRFQNFKTSTYQIGPDKYISYREIFDDYEDDLVLFRDVPNSKYAIRIQTNLKPENLYMLGKIFEKNGNSGFKEIKSSAKDIKTQKEYRADEVFDMAKFGDRTYTNDYLGFKVIPPEDWDEFSVSNPYIRMRERKNSDGFQNYVTMRLHKDYVTYGSIDSEIQHNLTRFDGMSTVSTEKILGRDCKTVAFEDVNDYVHKFYYIEFMDGEYILEIETYIDLPSAFHRVIDFDINKVITPIDTKINYNSNAYLTKLNPDTVLDLGTWKNNAQDYKDYSENIYKNEAINMMITKPEGWSIYGSGPKEIELKSKNVDKQVKIKTSVGLANLRQEDRKKNLLDLETLIETGEEEIDGINYYTVTTKNKYSTYYYKDYYRDIDDGRILINIRVEYYERDPLDISKIISKLK